MKRRVAALVVALAIALLASYATFIAWLLRDMPTGDFFDGSTRTAISGSSPLPWVITVLALAAWVALGWIWLSYEGYRPLLVRRQRT